jgi:hypothetical protein
LKVFSFLSARDPPTRFALRRTEREIEQDLPSEAHGAKEGEVSGEACGALAGESSLIQLRLGSPLRFDQACASFSPLPGEKKQD